MAKIAMTKIAKTPLPRKLGLRQRQLGERKKHQAYGRLIL
jgi:hypothetical protein